MLEVFTICSFVMVSSPTRAETASGASSELEKRSGMNHVIVFAILSMEASHGRLRTTQPL